MVTHTEIMRNHRFCHKEAKTKPAIPEIRYQSIVRTPLVAPFRIRDDGIVVIDELPAGAHADPLRLGVADLCVSEFQIPGVFIWRTERRLLSERPGILHL